MAASLEQRQEQDEATLYAMASIFCKKKHGSVARNERGVCALCDKTVSYSLKRTAQCVYEHTGNCQDCPIHCYEPTMRTGIKEIMRYGAPRMIFRHPLMTAGYLHKKINRKRAFKKTKRAKKEPAVR